MARQLYPDPDTNINGLNPYETDYVTEEQLAALANQVSILSNAIAATTNDLNEYKEQMLEHVRSAVADIGSLTADQIDAVTANLTNGYFQNLQSVNGTITALNSTTVIADTVSGTQVNGENASFTDTVSTTNLNATNKVTATEVETQNLIVNGAHNFDTLNANNITASQLTADTIESTTAHLTNVDIDTASITNAGIDNALVQNANIADIQNTHIETEYITHDTENGTILAAEGDYIIVELPKFVNGYAQLAITDADGNLYFAAEAHNSMNNWMVKYSQAAFEDYKPLQTIAFYNNAEDVTQCYFKILIGDSTYRWYYKINSLDTQVSPQLYVNEWPIPTGNSGFIEYRIVSYYLSATLFNKPVIDSSSGASSTPLTISPTDIYDLADKTAKTYDTTAAVISRNYKPNQELNTYSDVEFNTVEAPFLNIANAEVQNKFTAPNIYNGTAPADLSTLDDETLYLPIGGSTSGTLGDGWAINKLPNTKLRGYASTLLKSFNHQTYDTEYTPQQGYAISYGANPDTFQTPYLDPASLVSGEAYKAKAFIAIDNLTNTPYYFIFGTNFTDGTEAVQAGKLAYITAKDIAPQKYFSVNDFFTDDTKVHIFEPAEWEENAGVYTYNGTALIEGTEFYVENETSDLNVPNGTYTVVYTDTFILLNNDVSYTRTGSGSKISRKTTKNGVAQVLPIIPFEDSPSTTTTTTYYTDGNDIMDVNGNVVVPQGTAGAQTAVGSFAPYNGAIYKEDNGDYYEVSGFTDTGALVEDPALIAELQGETFVTIYSVPYTVTTGLDDTHVLVYDSTKDAIVKSAGNLTFEGDLHVKGDLTVDGETALNDDLTVTGDISATGDATIGGDASIAGNTSITGTLEVTDTTTLNDDLTVNADETVTGDLEVQGNIRANELNVANDVIVGGDLWVNGATHSTTVEELTAQGDVITVRANNSSALGTGQVSGLVVHAYNGIDDLALVADEDGTLRVGTGVGTDTTYTKIALKAADGMYYTYDDTDPDNITYTLLNPQPSGTMMTWSGKQEVTGYTLWASATFTIVDKTSLEPIMTRDEEANMTDGALIKWDATDLEGKTIAKPANDSLSLVSDITTAATSDNWTDGTNFYNSSMQMIVGSPKGTAGTSVSIGNAVLYQGVWYTDVSSTWYPITAVTTSAFTTGTAVSDAALIDVLDSLTPVAISYVPYTTVANDGYNWKDTVTPVKNYVDAKESALRNDVEVGMANLEASISAKASNYVFNTMADYTAVASTIPNGSIVVIKDETTYVYGA